MIMHDKKRALAIILAKRGPDGEEARGEMKPESSMDEAGEPDGQHQAAEDMLMAIQEKSADKFSQALSAFLDLRETASEPEEEADE